MQGNRILIAAITGLTAITLSSSNFATTSIPCGWFLEGNVGSSHLSGVKFGGSTSSSGIGGNVNLGYKFMPYVSGEIGVSQYAGSNVKDQYGNKAGSVKHYSYDISGKGILPIADSGFELFAKVGAARIIASVSIESTTAANNIGLGSGQHSSTGYLAGAGAQYYFMPEIAVVGQWARVHGNSSSGTEDLYSLGLSFIFD